MNATLAQHHPIPVMTPPTITEIPANASLAIILRARTDEGALITALIDVNAYEALALECPAEDFMAIVKPIDDKRFDTVDQNTFSIVLLLPLDENSFRLIPMARMPGMPFTGHPEADSTRAMCTLIAGVKDMELRTTLITAVRNIAHQRHSYLLEALNFVARKMSEETPEETVGGS